MNSVSGLDKRLQQVLTRPEFLEMRGVAKEVPIFIQTYSPADEDALRVVVKGAEQYLRKQGLRVKHVNLFELVLQLLESEGWLQKVELPRFRGQVSGLHMNDCRGCRKALLVIDWTEETDR